MLTAIDTNILLDILVPNPGFYDASVRWLEQSSNMGSLVVCDLVYAELLLISRTGTNVKNSLPA